MGRVWQSGLETGVLDATTEFNQTFVGGLETTTVRTGTYSLKVTSSTLVQVESTSLGNLSELYARAYWFAPRAGVYTGGNNHGVLALYNGTTVIAHCQVEIDQTGDLFNFIRAGYFDGTSMTNVAGSLRLYRDQWHLIEMHWVKSGTVGVLEIRVDGEADPSLTLSNINTGVLDCQTVRFGQRQDTAGATTTGYLDDFAVNDTQGSVNNSWCGAGGILLLKPEADTGTINWTAQNGGSHFAEIDDLPGAAPDTTTYIKTTSTTLNLEDRWDFSDLPAVVDVVAARIKAVLFGVRGGGTGTTTRTAKFQARDASDNVFDGSDIDWNLNGWKTVYPILGRNQTWEGTPGDLTPTYINGVKGAAIDTNTNNREIRWTAVWASVDYLNPEPVMQPTSRFFSPIFSE
jgi:hypothetical protein